VPDDPLAAALAEIGAIDGTPALALLSEAERASRKGYAPEFDEAQLDAADNAVTALDLARLCLLAAVDETVRLHGSVPWYCAASDCEHPEPAEDSEEHDDWYDDHTSGTGGIVVCLLTQVDSLCPECTRLKYDTLEPEGDDFVSAPCDTRLAILAALTRKAADDA
jgi:hypothetical protein